jgi:hypothetical protein
MYSVRRSRKWKLNICRPQFFSDAQLYMILDLDWNRIGRGGESQLLAPPLLRRVLHATACVFIFTWPCLFSFVTQLTRWFSLVYYSLHLLYFIRGSSCLLITWKYFISFCVSACICQRAAYMNEPFGRFLLRKRTVNLLHLLSTNHMTFILIAR